MRAAREQAVVIGICVSEAMAKQQGMFLMQKPLPLARSGTGLIFECGEYQIR